MIVIESIRSKTIEEQAIEIVERKGLGHPDTLADGIAENVSRELSKEYLRRYGMILHHNTDKTEIVGGRARVEFGGGEIIQPIFILLSGRATTFVNDEVFPVSKIAIKAAKEYLKKTLKNLNVETDVVIDSRIGQGSVDLTALFKKSQEMKYPPANDTSVGVGYAPLSETERIVLEIERYMNSRKFKNEFKETGEDIKVMALREKNKIKITIACAFISKYINSLNEYKSVKESVLEHLKDYISGLTSKEFELYLNTADDYERGIIYLTVTGTSAEMGDDGSVGRGNRVNGLITPTRLMSMEAAAGKNPVSHVGKLYNILAFRIAEDIYKLGVAKEVYVKILSQIGRPINEPKIVSISLITDKDYREYEQRIREIVQERLEKITEITKEIIDGKISVF